jgi:putative mRNA 3-end processing factor
MPVAAQVESYDFSAHADAAGLRTFLDSYRDATVLVNHGDRCVAFADDLTADGYRAAAPTVGETVSVGPATLEREA